VLAGNNKTANCLGLLSIFVSVVPLLYVFHSEMFPTHALTETAVLVGGVGGSLLAALSAGVSGSRWWFIAGLATVVDVVVLWGFSP
jgi:hypothetical protein